MNQPELATIQLYQSVCIYQEIQEESAKRINAGDYSSVEEHAIALYKLGAVDNTPTHREYLMKSYNLWINLAKLAPHVESYQKNVAYIAQLLNKE